MKLFAVLLIASLCATAWSASPIATREITESLVKVQELSAKVTPALSVARGKIDSFVRALGQSKVNILVKFYDLTTKIQGVNEKLVINSSINKVQQHSLREMKARLQSALERLDKLKNEILKLQ